MLGIDRSFVKTPYYKSETPMGLLWKGKLNNKWVEFWNKEVGYFTPEEEAKIARAVDALNLPGKRKADKGRTAPRPAPKTVISTR